MSHIILESTTKFIVVWEIVLSHSLFHIVTPLAYVFVFIRVGIRSCSVSRKVFHLSLIVPTIRISNCAWNKLIILPYPIETDCRAKLKFAFSMSFILHPLTLILLSSIAIVDALTFLHVIHPITFILGSIRVDIMSETISGSVYPISFENLFPVGWKKRAFSMRSII